MTFRVQQGPSSTYRLQITPTLTLIDATAVMPYLARLGVGAVYVSPLLQSSRGSDHGYDVVDHALVDPNRGGDAGLVALADTCEQLGLSVVVDIVPNHMGVADPTQNHAWWDVLRRGRQSAYSRWFDIDWAAHDGRILLPILGDDADLTTELTCADGELRYYDHRLPIAPGTESGTPTQIHDRQHYELVSFRLADTDQDYRRFFAVTDLAGLRVEDPEVFAATHGEILRWVRERHVTGLRVDHPDGLVDPEAYLRHLAAAAPDAWITVEKITEPGERLPARWPVAGMTGYDALSEVNSVFVDPGAAERMTAIYCDTTGDTLDFAEHVAKGKRLVATTILRAEVERLARLVPAINEAAKAITELAVAFPVYRSYLPLGQEHLEDAAELAVSRAPALRPAVIKLLPLLADPRNEIAARFQQLTGAIMAKGVEDTAFYRYNRLISLNEVGGYPGSFGLSLEEFHAALQVRQRRTPAGMTTLSTHDTKRGEDIRAHLNVLAELPEEWSAAISHLTKSDDIPNRAFSYLLWQTVLAMTSLALCGSDEPKASHLATRRKRLHAYLEKAMREAADGTGWIDPDTDYEATVHAAADLAFDDDTVRGVVADLAGQTAPYGWSNSLSQKVVQLAMPGVPDVYQGSELWEDSLVDPDNRRPVDFARRSNHLDVLDEAATPPPDVGPDAKLWLVARVLRARRDRPELFATYNPLRARGAAADHLIAFDRGGAVALATRLPHTLATSGGWGDTSITLPAGRFRDGLSNDWYDGEVAVGRLLHHYPTALLIKDENG